MENQTGHIDQIKQLNTGIVYRVIDQYGPISRIALSKQSQLAPASITKITRELIDAHLVKEIEFPVLGLRGRPAIGLVIESEGWQFLSIRLACNSISLSLKEINTQTIVEQDYPFDVKGNEQFSNTLSSLISHFFATYSRHLERVTAISIVLDGLVEPFSGVIYALPYYDIDNLPLGHFLTEQTGLPTYIQPYVNALALADYFSLYEKRTAKNIIYLQIDCVVSAAIINNGIALDSHTRRAIHFGHVQTQNTGETCYCGGIGCLEGAIAIPAILKHAVELQHLYPSSSFFNHDMTIDSFCLAVEDQDPLCLHVLNDIAQILAKQLGQLINIFGTELILINSPLNRISSVFYSLLHQYCHSQSIPLYRGELRIEQSEVTKKESETALVQQALYDGSLLLQLLQG
ncbi:MULTISPECIES: ROK family protein [Providencia]|uniref:Transcriptional repressor for glucose uptake and glycolysis, global repressor of carbohydrate metabolism (NagC/XylR (ROK) family) protein n=1 Tax=Providencia stuartii (strain MRSN 2154) TaxID=1157951 RepID=A0A140NE10_PROSM|nr:MULTISPECIES: ROK family protein [Providencia]SST01133.1 Making large colonies protein [Acinetobacter baumannii]AFH91964.1 transcriptional repressor for glucose uptake and glycolysis, global repressor of carbohydrate metabolism (NagC/XylR (ROK) family) protein [Providencia stuartii MRSN 2154]AIN63797.1 ROK family protein [Providencia stuartii]AVE43488.1 DNA-binding transcriptional repressor DgsA [Providencia stuartii]EMD1715698.1 ROK family protein [Providencia stuartii]